MKKKIIFTILIVSLLVTVFAISVSAVTYTYKDASENVLFSFEYANVKTPFGNNSGDFIASNKQGGFAKVDSEGNQLTWYITDTVTDGDGNKTFTVASLKTMGEAGDINANGAYSFKSPVTNKNTVSVNFPDNAGIKTWAFNSFGGFGSFLDNNILFVYCPNTLTAFANNPFQETPVMVVEIDDETPITKIPQNFCHEARNLTAINIPSSVDEIYSSGSQNGAAFYNCRSLTSVTFAENSVLVKINNNAFLACKALKEIYLPNSVTTFGERIFQACDSLETISFGAKATNLTQSITYQSTKIKYIYLPKTVTTITGSHAFEKGAKDTVFFYTGTFSDYEALKALLVKGTNNGLFVNATPVEWNKANSEQYYKDLATSQNKAYIVYGYNTCEAFYNGVHDIKQEGDNKCSGVCGNCGKIELIQNPIHTYEWIFNDNKAISYTVAFKAESKCKFCATANQDEEIVEIGAILYSNGISIDETDYTGIYEQIKVDKTALEEYSKLSEKAFDYGIFALAAGEAETSAPITKGQDGKATADDKTVYASFTGTEYTYLRIKITGLSNGSSIFCGAYLIIGDNVIYVSNKQEGKEVNKYTMVTEQA